MEIVPIGFTSIFFLFTIVFWVAIVYAVVLLFRYLKQLVETQEDIAQQVSRVANSLENRSID